MKKNDWLKLIIISVLVCLVYLPTVIWMIDRWLAQNSFYGHGFLVPFVSLFIVWRNRKKLDGLNFSPHPLGWFFFIGGIFAHIISAFWQVYFSSGFSMLFVVIGLVLLFLGTRFLKLLIFPILFLAFMIPLPMVALADITFGLKVLASICASFLVRIFGVMATREGSVIITKHSYLIVDDSCSGVKSLIAMIGLAVLMAYLCPVSKVRQIILSLSSIPIAFVTNTIRITLLILISEYFGARFAVGLFHDFVGVMIFVLAFLCLTAVKKMLEKQ